MNKTIHRTVAMLLWLATTILAGYEVFLGRHIVHYSYLLLLDNLSLNISIREHLKGISVGNIASLIMAIIAIAIVVGGFDYHWEYAGEMRSYKIITLTLIFQFFILALYIVLGTLVG